MSKRTFWAAAVLLYTAAAADAGVNSWSPMGPEGGEVRKIVLHPTNPDIAVAIALSGVYRTTDGAATWTKSAYEFQNPPYELQMDPSDPNRLYVIAFNDPPLVVSTDGGVTFEPFTGLPVTNPYQPRLGLGTGGVMYFSVDLRVFRSEDRGANWSEQDPILLPSGARVQSLVVDALNSDNVYAAAGENAFSPALFVSNSRGANWTQRNSAPNLAPSPLVPGELWSARSDGLWRSQDYAATWTNVGFPEGVYGFALTGRDSNLDIVVRTMDAALRSLDGGANWSDITGDLPRSMRQVVTHPLDADRILFSGRDGISVPGAAPGTWVSSHAGIVATEVQKLAVDPAADRVYAFTGSIHASVAGADFVRVNDHALPTMGSSRLPVMTIHARPGNLLALLSDQLAESNDGGATWSLIPGYLAGPHIQLRLLSSAAAAPQNLIAAGTPNAFRSANGGVTWTPITGGLPPDFGTFDIAFAESDPSVVYFGPHVLRLGSPEVFGVYRSSDGGTTWAPANGGIADLGAYDIEVDPTDSRVVYAIAGDTFVKSTDSGDTWRTLRRSLSSFARIAIDPTHPRVIYIAYGENYVLRSVDGGESFETLLSFATRPWWSPRVISVDPRRPHIVNLATGGFGVQQMSIEPDLELRFTAFPGAPSAGAMLSYTLLATNRGPFGASGARVTMQLAAEMAEISATSQGGSCTTDQRTVVCDLSSMAAQASIGITVTARAPGEGFVTASATVEGDQPDPDASNNARSHSAPVSAAAPPSTPSPSSGGGGVGGAGGGAVGGGGGAGGGAVGGGGGGGAGLSLLLMLLGTLPLMRKMRSVDS